VFISCETVFEGRCVGSIQRRKPGARTIKPTRVFLCDALAKLLDRLCYFTLERSVNPVSTEIICFKQVPIPIFHQASKIRVRQMILWMVAEGLDAVNLNEGGRFRHMP